MRTAPWPCRDEANEEVRVRAVAALGSWQNRLAHVPEALAQRFCQGLTEKEPYRRAHLLLLVRPPHPTLHCQAPVLDRLVVFLS